MRPRPLVLLRTGLAVVAVAAALVALLTRPTGPPAAARPEAAHPTARVPAVVEVAAADSAVAAPTSVSVPSVGIRSTLVALTVDATGTLDPPADTATAGWFAQGPAPGAVGPAVLTGHVDSSRGPGAFFRLSGVAPGADVMVGRADGSTARFTVVRVDRYPKDAFPTAQVYGPTPGPELRLITCGGAFDRGARSYEQNVVVYARLAG